MFMEMNKVFFEPKKEIERAAVFLFIYLFSLTRGCADFLSRRFYWLVVAVPKSTM